MAKKKINRQHDCLALALQGGGALGAYQVGVIQALQETGHEPDWYIGTSIGAINAAIAAGNPPETRLDKMLEFWETITRPTLIDDSLMDGDATQKKLQHYLSAQTSLLLGQPGFFVPRFPPSALGWEHDPTKISFYDTTPLKATLEKLIDFDRINQAKTRLSVGAVEIMSGRIIYFDSKTDKITAEHIMASGALPPGFPAIEIDGKMYWDGGISSNSPMTYALGDCEPKALLCFMINLFDSYGMVPTSMDEILKRRKDIEFSSRFNKVVKMYQEVHALRYRIHQLGDVLTPEQKNIPEMQECLEYGWDKSVALVRFQYRGDVSDLSSKDYEFSKKTVHEHILAGYEDGIRGVKLAPWLDPVPEDIGIALHDMYINDPGVL